MRRIPLSHRSHITGFQTLPVSGLTEHESALERDFVALTTFRDAAARIISQPITLSFREGPAPRRYTPDFLVHCGDGRSELVEVKYRADLREHWREFISINTAMISTSKWNELIGYVPQSAVLTETDGPFAKLKGQPAIPSDVQHVVEWLAEKWKLSANEADLRVMQNADRLVARTAIK